MRTTIQRGGIFFVSMIFALAVGMASAAQDHDDDDGDNDTPRKCYWKHETQELCYINEFTGKEKCSRRTTEEWECESISDTPP